MAQTKVTIIMSVIELQIITDAVQHWANHMARLRNKDTRPAEPTVLFDGDFSRCLAEALNLLRTLQR